jgi:hypothetical protein
LKKSENAWKPAVPSTEEEKSLKKIVGILNKVSPDNLEVLVAQLKENFKLET